MQELARTEKAQKSPDTSLSFFHHPEKAIKTHSYTNGGFQLFRKTTCPCDGGCPRCSPIQAKLRIGEPDDEYEKEADRVAEQVMRMPDPVLQPKRKCPLGKGTSCKEYEDEIKDKTLMKKEAQAPVRNSYVPPIVHDVLQSPGKPLDTDIRTFFEPRFGHDFSNVKIHKDAKAAESARAVNALAYTVGKDLIFGEGLANDRQLIAHELMHVVQQAAGGSNELRLQDDGSGGSRWTPDSNITGARGTEGTTSILPTLTEEEKIAVIRVKLRLGTQQKPPIERKPDDTGGAGGVGGAGGSSESGEAYGAGLADPENKLGEDGTSYNFSISELWESFGSDIGRVAKANMDLWEDSKDDLRSIEQVNDLINQFPDDVISLARENLETSKEKISIWIKSVNRLDGSDRLNEPICNESNANKYINNEPDKLYESEFNRFLDPQLNTNEKQSGQEFIETLQLGAVVLKEAISVRDNLLKISVYSNMGTEGSSHLGHFDLFNPNNPYLDYLDEPESVDEKPPLKDPQLVDENFLLECPQSVDENLPLKDPQLVDENFLLECPHQWMKTSL